MNIVALFNLLFQPCCKLCYSNAVALHMSIGNVLVCVFIYSIQYETMKVKFEPSLQIITIYNSCSITLVFSNIDNFNESFKIKTDPKI